MGLCSSKKQINKCVAETTEAQSIEVFDDMHEKLVSTLIVHHILELDIVPAKLIPIKCPKDILTFINATSERNFLPWIINSIYPKMNYAKLSYYIGQCESKCSSSCEYCITDSFPHEHHKSNKNIQSFTICTKDIITVKKVALDLTDEYYKKTRLLYYALEIMENHDCSTIAHIIDHMKNICVQLEPNSEKYDKLFNDICYMKLSKLTFDDNDTQTNVTDKLQKYKVAYEFFMMSLNI